jgi:hypothetical protein
MHDAADDSAIVRPLNAPDIRRQVRLDGRARRCAGVIRELEEENKPPRLVHSAA